MTAGAVCVTRHDMSFWGHFINKAMPDPNTAHISVDCLHAVAIYHWPAMLPDVSSPVEYIWEYTDPQV